MKKYFLSVIILFLAAMIFAEEELDLFKQAAAYVQVGEKAKAAGILEKYLTDYPEGEYRKNAYFMLYDVLPEDSIDKRLVVAMNISELYSEDGETDKIRIDIANRLLRVKNYFEAAKWYMEIVLFSQNRDINYEKATANLQKIIEKNLEPMQLEFLYYNYYSENFTPMILYQLFKKYEEEKDAAKKEIYRQKLIKEFPESYYTKKYIIEIEEARGSKKKIAILLQLTGDFSAYGELVKRGCVIANEEEAMDVVIFDTQGSAVRTAELTDSIYRDNTFIAVIGPITSNEAIISGAYLLRDKILPVISPTAADGEILKLNNVYLANKTLVEQAMFSAQTLSADTLVKNVGIFFPDDSYGRTLSTSFKKEAKRLGLNIVFDIGYPAGTQDFIETIKLIENIKTDAIYIPSSHEDAILLLTQLAYSDIKCKIVGSDTWYNENLIRLAKDYMSNTFIIAPKSINRYSDEYANYRMKYMKKYLEEPERFSMLSYDSFKLLAKLMKNGYNTRKNIVNYLNQMEYYEGVSGRISFKGERLDFDVYTVENGALKRKG